MMRVPVLLTLLLAASALQAAPVPPPPGDFSGRQYIDGQGCVFQRSDAGWQARLDGGGQPLCGFPPSIEMRRLDPDSTHVLRDDAPEPPADPAALLAARLAEDLRQADLAEPVPKPAPASAAPSALGEQIAVSLSLQQRAAEQRNVGSGMPADLCRRLGYGDRPVDGGVPDPTGFCPGLRPPAPAVLVQDRAPASRANPAPARPAAAPPSRGRAASPPTRQAGAEPSRPVANPGVEMIPAHARYVQIGVFLPDEADRAIRALAAKGLPAVRLRAEANRPVVIMAGPFGDRQALISALNRLRAEGWPGAVAR